MMKKRTKTNNYNSYNKSYKQNYTSSYKKNKFNNHLSKNWILEAGSYIFNNLKDDICDSFKNKECFNDELRNPNINIPDDLDYDDIFLINNDLKENIQFERIKQFSLKYYLKNQVNEELSNEFDLDNEEIPDWYEDDELDDNEFKNIVNNTNKFNEETKIDNNLYLKEMENNINKLLNRENDSEDHNNSKKFECKEIENNINKLLDLNSEKSNSSFEEEDDDISKSFEEDDEDLNNQEEDNKFNNILNIFNKNNININVLNNKKEEEKIERNNKKEEEIINKEKKSEEVKIEEIVIKEPIIANEEENIKIEEIIKKNKEDIIIEPKKKELSNEELENLKKIKKEQFIWKYSYLDNIICCMAYDTFNSRNIEKINKHSIVGIKIENIILYTSHSYKIFSYYVQGKIFDRFWFYKDKLKITQGPWMSFDMDIYNIKGNVFDNETWISPDNINFLPYSLYQDREIIAINTIQNQINNLENHQQKNNYQKYKNSNKNRIKSNKNNNYHNQRVWKKNYKKQKLNNNLTNNLKSLLGIDKEKGTIINN